MTEAASIRGTCDGARGDTRADAVRRFEQAAQRWVSSRSAGATPDATTHAAATTAVLVEGTSDRAALLALAELHQRDLAAEGVAVLPMGGAMSIRRFVGLLGPSGFGMRLRGMCDAHEVGFFERAGMPADGYQVCEPDLEGEFIRALGLPRIEAVLAAQGDLRLFRTFQQQPAQRPRSTEKQLHRFFGTTSGRKEHYARELVLAAGVERVPAPLNRLLDSL
ncbi:TOPRIM nucleotidyl transferase/hydrolase domain-containing protein [Leifsonia poae]|uniref:OLD protein-like TOPRIM domain-containing protein n=1 Tax=Leifsonia poae TaxID=110933 RepID=A0A9W6M0Q1_9MICO|nr:TOPRIM nucleotidyl transferase/hydrolase domain-containing protein [Leifsonia poae]GLJ76904.1 hypothetical protein GCM10017584_24780 [Leifsonia poae]